MTSVCALVFISAAATTFLSCCISSGFHLPIVHTKLGTLIGKTEASNGGTLVDAYLGIPYAEPPTGELRFKKTIPAKPWKDPRLAISMSSACVQYSTSPFPWKDFQHNKSEDCLYLNIWVPNSDSSGKKAVMFWIYGGGFSFGSNRQPWYDGKQLATYADAIVVNVNYRLGVLGFFYSGTDDAVGNAGLYDTLEALHWVNENIENFGGDKEKITLFGHSAGAMVVGYLCISPLARGLFRRVILQSGSPAQFSIENETHNLDMGQALAKRVGCATDTVTIYTAPKQVVNCLRGVDSHRLVVEQDFVTSHAAESFLPRYGDEILPRIPREAVIEMEFQDADLFIGIVRDESSFSLTTMNTDIFGFFGQHEPEINKTLGSTLLEKALSTFQAKNAAIHHYLDPLNKSDYFNIRKHVYMAESDYTIICPTVYFAEKYAERNNKVYYYFFNHRPTTSVWAPWMGVVHFDEIQFVFGLPLIETDSTQYSANEMQLSRDMMASWASFAKSGKPKWNEDNNWPPYSRKKPVYAEIRASNWSFESGPHKENCDFFRPYFGFL